MVPLDALSEDPEFGLGGSRLKFDGPGKEDLIPEFLKECTVNGRTYAMPFMRSTEACYINKTYVEKLGYTLSLIHISFTVPSTTWAGSERIFS